MFRNAMRPIAIPAVWFALCSGCGTADDAPPGTPAATSGASAGGAGSTGGAGGTGGAGASGGVTSTGAGTGGAPPTSPETDPCILAVQMRDCCWEHVAVRQSVADAEPCIADYPLSSTAIPRELDLECRAAQAPPCEPAMGVCLFTFLPPATGAKAAADGICRFTG